MLEQLEDVNNLTEVTEEEFRQLIQTAYSNLYSRDANLSTGLHTVFWTIKGKSRWWTKNDKESFVILGCIRKLAFDKEGNINHSPNTNSSTWKYYITTEGENYVLRN